MENSTNKTITELLEEEQRAAKRAEERRERAEERAEERRERAEERERQERKRRLSAILEAQKLETENKRLAIQQQQFLQFDQSSYFAALSSNQMVSVGGHVQQHYSQPVQAPQPLMALEGYPFALPNAAVYAGGSSSVISAPTSQYPHMNVTRQHGGPIQGTNSHGHGQKLGEGASFSDASNMTTHSDEKSIDNSLSTTNGSPLEESSNGSSSDGPVMQQPNTGIISTGQQHQNVPGQQSNMVNISTGQQHQNVPGQQPNMVNISTEQQHQNVPGQQPNMVNISTGQQHQQWQQQQHYQSSTMANVPPAVSAHGAPQSIPPRLSIMSPFSPYLTNQSVLPTLINTFQYPQQFLYRQQLRISRPAEGGPEQDGELEGSSIGTQQTSGHQH